MRVGTREIGPGHPCYIIAEIGINHNGDVEIAKQLMRAAAEAGVDAVKFQVRRALEESVPKHMWDMRKETPWGEMSYMEYKERLELPNEVYRDVLYPLARELNIHVGVSVWDRWAAQQVANICRPDLYTSIFDFLKVPSAHMSNETVMHHTATRGLPFFWSTGMHDLGEIQRTIRWLEDYGCDNWGIFHCNSSYPASNNELNLRVVSSFQLWRTLAGHPVGYSGHETGLATTVAAVALGAHMVERHITLDRSMWGTDHAASVEPQGFERLVKDIRAVEEALGDGIKVVFPSELGVRKKLSLT